MYRELQPLRQALSAELKAHLSPAGPGIDPEHLLQTYLDRLTMYVGCDKVRAELVDAYALAEQINRLIQERPETRLLCQVTGAGPSRRELDVFKDFTAVRRMQQPRQGQCIRPGIA